jgi:hypothetical protein
MDHIFLQNREKIYKKIPLSLLLDKERTTHGLIE